MAIVEIKEMSNRKVNPDAAITKIYQDEINVNLNLMYDSLFKNSSGNNQLTEELFTKYFLPFFSGQIKDDPNLNIVTHWIAIAGSPMNPVDIVNEQGKVLFTVPALASTGFLQQENRNNAGNFFQIISTANLQANRIPILGERVIANQGVNLLNTLASRVNSKTSEDWNNIFRRYDIPVHSDSNKEIKTDNNKDNNKFDDLCFD